MTKLHNCRTEFSTATACEQSVNVATTSLRTMGRKVIARSQDTSDNEARVIGMWTCRYKGKHWKKESLKRDIYLSKKKKIPRLFSSWKTPCYVHWSPQSTLVLSIWINIWVILICVLRFPQWCCRRLESSGFDTQGERAKDTSKRKLNIY